VNNIGTKCRSTFQTSFCSAERSIGRSELSELEGWSPSGRPFSSQTFSERAEIIFDQYLDGADDVASTFAKWLVRQDRSSSIVDDKVSSFSDENAEKKSGFRIQERTIQLHSSFKESCHHSKI
jgi:hypothetical protein